MSREQIIAEMNKIVDKAQGQFNCHLWKEYYYLNEELEKIDSKV